ncbi:hypothetical protein F53441_3259 [Fusarium austroafricanum]|uniref:Rhodopsin domain-containing protein n=1 Tax=Fusarium austroafricanum TaxID=2364996 RepID=A0A8H4KS43_9HYPO|nr:hypothetical protein F53441_3259 [Fusarium austroafricanum]
MALDPSATSVDPQGLARANLGIIIFFLIPTALVVALRCYVRLKYRLFGTDDGLMLLGWILHVAFSAAGIQAVYAGLGTKDEDLNAYLQVHGRKCVWIGQMLYSWSLIPLKCSISVTLLRIAVTKTHRIIVWGTIVGTVIPMLYVVIASFAVCRPIEANWTGQGTCSIPVIKSLGYTVSISAVVTDWVCAILPVFMLYKAHMRKATKVSVSIILGLAALASLCTIIRLPYLKSFSNPNINYLYNVGNIVIWSTVESGIGIVAGSLPSLRKLVSNRFHFDSSTDRTPANTTPFSGTNRAVITSQTATKRRSQRGEREGDWHQLDDEGSSSQKIYVKVEMEMQSLERPETSRASHTSREDLV